MPPEGEFEETMARGLSLQLNTFTDLRDRGSALAQWVEGARSLVEQPFLAWAKDRPFGFRTPDGYWIGVGGAPINGDITALEWNEENWQLLLSELRQGRLRTLRLLGDLQDGLGIPRNDLGGFLVQVDLGGLEYEGAASALVANVGRPLFGDALDAEIQSEWVRHAKAGAREFDAATGFMTIDYASPYESPYEMSIWRYWIDGWRECDQWLRGYYWGNFLSRHHIRRLGGMKRITQEAPCEVVEDLSDGREERAYLQLSSDIDDISDDALRKLRDFFRPVLPQPEGSPPYRGPPLRVV